MKKSLCILILSIVSITTFGQVIPKGTRFIGGDLSFNFLSIQEDGVMEGNSIQLGVSPAYTQFVKDNFSITYVLGYNIQSTGTRTSFGNQFYSAATHTVSAGVRFANYKMISDKLGLSVQYGGQVGYLFNTISRDIAQGNNVQGVTLGINAGPGIIYLLNEKFAIEGTASIINLNVAYSWIDNDNIINVGTGLSASPGLGIGFRYFLK
ncbi:hypothetical protein [Emticicia soli]|uniref:Outer membrane protein beta-barrel domain-containing protein n=1 Tax=Emticicia soli TaxID=2027878 RepID=A0ABW5J4U0_9BACT